MEGKEGRGFGERGRGERRGASWGMGARVWSLDMTGSGRWRHVPTITGRIDWRADSRMSSGPAWRTCPAYFWEPPRERAGRRSRLLLTAPTAVGTDGSPEHVLDHYREAFGVVIRTGWSKSAGQDPYRKGDERPVEFRAFRLKAPDQWILSGLNTQKSDSTSGTRSGA